MQTKSSYEGARTEDWITFRVNYATNYPFKHNKIQHNNFVFCWHVDWTQFNLESLKVEGKQVETIKMIKQAHHRKQNDWDKEYVNSYVKVILVEPRILGIKLAECKIRRTWMFAKFFGHNNHYFLHFFFDFVLTWVKCML